MPRRSSRPPQPHGITINTNTVLAAISTLIGGVVLYMVTTGMNKVDQTATDVKEVKTALPFLQSTIGDLKADVKDVQHEQARVREDKH